MIIISNKIELEKYLTENNIQEINNIQLLNFKNEIQKCENCNFESCISHLKPNLKIVNNQIIFFYKNCDKYLDYIKKLKIKKILENSNLSEIEKQKGFDNFIINKNNEKIVKTLKDMLIQGNYKSIILTGNNGIGKTHLAIAYLKKFVYKTCLPVFFYQSNSLFNSLRCAISNNQFYDILETIKNVNLLVIDDLGTTKITDFILDYFFDIIDYRYKNHNKLFTIITSNFQKPSDFISYFSENIGPKIISRLLEISVWLSWGDKDWRINKYEKK